MNSIRLRLVLTALTLTFTAAISQAQVFRTPLFSLDLGRPAVPAAPTGSVVVPQGTPVVPLPAPVSLPEPGAPPAVPLVVPSAPVPPVGAVSPVPGPRLLTVSEFAATFKAPPCGGSFEVVLQHPYTCQPVKVCFRLPGCPKRVSAGKAGIVFRYGLCKAVTIRFYPDGGVSVRD